MTTARLALASALLLSACGEDKPEPEDTAPPPGDSEVLPVDADQDGHPEDEDCDDQDPAVFPGADEVCNGIDDDCDEAVDEDAVDASTWYRDEDGDGYGDPGVTTRACEQPSGWVDDSSDCDDQDPAVFPGAVELLNGVDDDCDGEVDDFPPEEDCADGSDNDHDGLTDCEDDDCVDICLEDCSNGVDDDADRAIDCADDECFGLDSCEGHYRVELEVELDQFSHFFGDYIYWWYDVWASMALWGEATITGTPAGTHGTAFSCTGEFGSGMAQGQGLFYYGPGSSLDYTFTWEPTVAGGEIIWDANCPIQSFPSTMLGWNTNDEDPLYRLASHGSWYAQYVATDIRMHEHTAIGIGHQTWWSITGVDPVQQRTIIWDWSYEAP